MKQKVINLYGAPGSGKSTGAAYIFAALKMRGFNCELVTEYAKSRVWQEDFKVFQNQFYVTGKQSLYQSRLKGKVDVIITDSPIIQGALYAKELPYYESYKQVLFGIDDEYDNFNVYLTRVKVYNPHGRFQDEKGSDDLGKDIRKFLKDNNVAFGLIEGSKEGYDSLIEGWIETYTECLKA